MQMEELSQEHSAFLSHAVTLGSFGFIHAIYLPGYSGEAGVLKKLVLSNKQPVRNVDYRATQNLY